MSTFDIINSIFAIIGGLVVLAMPITIAILRKQRNNFRDLYIEARTDYLREINERRVSARNTGVKSEG